MRQKGRLEFDREGVWIPSVYGANLDDFIRDWLRGIRWPTYRWVEGGAVVYLPRRER